MKPFYLLLILTLITSILGFTVISIRDRTLHSLDNILYLFPLVFLVIGSVMLIEIVHEKITQSSGSTNSEVDNG